MISDRFTAPDRAEYDEQQREFSTRFTTGPRADPAAAFRLVDDDGDLIGPPAIWVLSPGVGLALSGIGREMRWGLDFSDRTREAVIIAVANTMDSAFERFAHEPAAAAAGWSVEELESIAVRRIPASSDDETSVALASTWEILDRDTLSEDSFSRLVTALGLQRAFQLVALVTYYRMVATQLAVFGVTPPDPSRA